MSKLSTFVMIAAALSASGCAIAVDQDQQPPYDDDGDVDVNREALYPKATALWPQNKAIDVCWQDPSPADATARGWVQDAVARSWQAVSNVRFTGWGTCPVSSSGVRIRVVDETAAPNTKSLGTGLKGVIDGVNLNFTFLNWSIICSTASEREGCVRSIAVHTALNDAVSLGDKARPEADINAYVDLLIAHGVDVNAPDLNGSSPLTNAIANGRFGAAEHLLDVGADARPGVSPSALELAVGNDPGGNLSPPSEPLQPRADVLRLVERLLDKGADPNFGGRWHVPPLFRAGPFATPILVRRGASIEARAEACEGGPCTPLMAAALAGEGDKVDALLHLGADVHATNARDCDALCFAVHGVLRYGTEAGNRFARDRARYKAIGERLVAAGANLQRADPEGRLGIQVKAVAKSVHPARVADADKSRGWLWWVAVLAALLFALRKLKRRHPAPPGSR